MATTFHPFPRLPYELRALIWASAIEPRCVDARALYGASLSRGSVDYNKMAGEASDPYVPELSPAILRTCRESRHRNLYQKIPYRKYTSHGQFDERYIWINYNMDTIDIGIGPFTCLKTVGSLIRRLRFQGLNDEFWFQIKSRDLRFFRNIVEYQVVAGDSVESW